MIIKYLGHSSFLFKADDGTTVLTDPYKPGAYGGALTYSAITDSADIVILSHEHEDHAYPISPWWCAPKPGCAASTSMSFRPFMTPWKEKSGAKTA